MSILFGATMKILSFGPQYEDFFVSHGIHGYLYVLIYVCILKLSSPENT
jgi:hypothetical protein